jgi:thiosulfate/3-mercaptopyruvate sulfurtransferase
MGSRSRPRRSRRRAVTASRRGKRSARPAARKTGARRKAARGAAAFKSPGSVVSTEWLASVLFGPHGGRENPRVRVVDGTWHMPQLQRNARREFEEAHIPGAVFFDIDEIADRTTALPHMLPTPVEFSRHMSALGLSSNDFIVVYDTRGVVSAARVWWTFRAFGHDRVAVLDGGLKKWKVEERPLATGAATPAVRRFRAKLRPALVRGIEQMRRNIETRREQVLDARSRGRFYGTEPEPRQGLRAGHIPGSFNLPYDMLYGPDGTLLPPEGLKEAFREAGLDARKPVTTTCGSGVTASVLALGLHLIGHKKVAVYDGSWTEWGGRADTPVEL